MTYSEHELEFTFAKNRLDNFWSNQEVVKTYDYKADLHNGIGNRSISPIMYLNMAILCV